MTAAVSAQPTLALLPRTVVAAAGLTKRFGGLAVLKGVDLAIKSGHVTAVLGPNAAGKSTLIKCILGLTQPDGGSLTVSGVPLNGDPAYRTDVGYMPQQARFP